MCMEPSWRENPLSFVRKTYHLIQANKNQWKTYDELRNIQIKKLKKIIHHAYHNVSFYHDLFKKNNLLPSDIKTIDDLNKIPIVSKEDICANYPKNVIAKNVNFSKTAYDQKADDFAKAIISRSYIENGLKYFDRWCVLGPPDYILEKPRSFFITQKMGFLSPFYVSIFDDMDKKISMIKRFNPRVLDSLSTDLFLLAKYIEEHDIEGINPEVVTTNGEILTDAMRKYINRVFNVELSDLYGCYEFRRTMPLIRYNIGDAGIPSDIKCSCGRGLPLMKILEGKLMDFLVAPDGTMISPYTVKINITGTVPGIQLCRIIQYSKENIKMLIVKNKEYTDGSTILIKNIFEKFLGNEVNVSIEFVEEIERVGRKYKFLESKIASAKIN